ncbi:hypothetical protein THOM_0982 [Trachipleistophora hominis]|uniref:Uncharacterized protein n=1 Tax=Trachipleistophora hominis TaxID=72359 RepID=L7JX49_TRAHO|nr:hypothetical protein THOM_0982 [Trachipleistophora hominis]
MLDYTINASHEEENGISTTGNSFFSRSNYILNSFVFINGRSPFIYKIFLIFCEKDPRNIIFNLLVHPQILEDVAPDILELYSSRKSYDDICWFIELLKSKQIEITPEMFNCINYSENVDKMAVDMIELQDYRIYVFETCRCGAISRNVKEHLQIALATGEKLATERINVEMTFCLGKRAQHGDKSTVKDAAEKQQNVTQTHDNNRIKKTKCTCKSKTRFNGIIVKRKNHLIGVYEVFAPQDLFVFIKRSRSKNLLMLEKNIFWNVITYFLIYDLPINFKETCNEEFELVIEENNDKRYFNLLKLPQIKFIN